MSEVDVDVLMIGDIAKDVNVVQGNTRVEPGGAVYYGSVALHHLSVSVAVVTRLHPDDMPLLEALKRLGIPVYAHPAPQTSGIENVYVSPDMDRRLTRPLGFAGPFSVEEIPDVRARVYALLPLMAGIVSLEVLRHVAARGPVALDVQGFVRVPEGDTLRFRPWSEMAEGLAHVTYLKVDRAEAETLVGETDPVAALHALRAYGPDEVVLTQAEGVMVAAGDEVYFAPFTPRSLAGRTGRGDTCFATYIGKRLTLPPAEACRWAAAVTTLKLEKPGPWDGDMGALREVLRRTEVQRVR